MYLDNFVKPISPQGVLAKAGGSECQKSIKRQLFIASESNLFAPLPPSSLSFTASLGLINWLNISVLALLRKYVKLKIYKCIIK